MATRAESRSRSRSISPALPSGPASDRRRPPRPRSRDRGYHHGNRGRSRSPSRSRSPPRERDGRGGGGNDYGSYRRGGRYRYRSRSPGGYTDQGRRGQDSRDRSPPYRGRQRQAYSPPPRQMSRDRDGYSRDGDGRRRGVDDAVRHREETGRKSPNQSAGHLKPADAEEEEMDEDQKMMAMLGFGGFESTKGKHVAGADMSGVSVKKTRTYRQYMNRRGGFNRALDAVQ